MLAGNSRVFFQQRIYLFPNKSWTGLLLVNFAEKSNKKDDCSAESAIEVKSRENNKINRFLICAIKRP